MGVLPLQFEAGQSAETLELTGLETFDLTGLSDELEPNSSMGVSAVGPNDDRCSFRVTSRLDTPNEVQYYRHGGILQFVLRSLLH